MIDEGKPVHVLLADGSIEAEVMHRLDSLLAEVGTPATWTSVAEARVHFAIARELKAIHDELTARPGLPWDEAMKVGVLLGQDRLLYVLERIRSRGGDL